MLRHFGLIRGSRRRTPRQRDRRHPHRHHHENLSAHRHSSLRRDNMLPLAVCLGLNYRHSNLSVASHSPLASESTILTSRISCRHWPFVSSRKSHHQPRHTMPRRTPAIYVPTHGYGLVGLTGSLALTVVAQTLTGIRRDTFLSAPSVTSRHQHRRERSCTAQSFLFKIGSGRPT